ncbi:MAG: hypothetical protein O3C10_07135 [Chloroflexi bacterium]|nr:hypothetical protein [Chloroflexota bacterium]
MPALRKLIGIAVFAIGVGVLAVGAFFIQQGYAAESEISDRLADEAVTITIDDVAYPVNSGERATAQALVIKSHTLERYGPWQTLERDSDERAAVLDGLVLRNSLNMARMGFDLSLMVRATGLVFAVIGMGLATTGAVVYALATRVNEEERKEVRYGAAVHAV